VLAVLETGGVVGQHGVEVGDVHVRLVPVDQRDPTRGHADVARVVGVAVHDAFLTSDEPRPRCSASSNAGQVCSEFAANPEISPLFAVREMCRAALRIEHVYRF
jgi:hypothetical protein